MFYGRPSGRPFMRFHSVNIYFARRDNSTCGQISMKLGTNVHRVIGHC